MDAIVGTQLYSWFQIYQEQGKKIDEHLDAVFGEVAAAGIAAWEGGCSSAEDAKRQKELLAKHGLVTRSMYVGGELHTPGWEQRLEAMLRQAGWGRSLGAQVVVCNPNPLGGGNNKSDEQLKVQAEALDTFGKRLLAEGLQLAYHTAWV